MRILVLGGSGMLGHKVVQRLCGGAADLWWTLRTTRDDPSLTPVPMLRGDHAIDGLNAADLGHLHAMLGDLRPGVVVNCLGLIKQRPEASELLPSLTLNTFVPHVVALRLREWGGRLIQISTDCVFSGRRGNYSETDATDAADVYGQTKALGEVRADNAVILRTSIIGRELKHHRSLLDWFLCQRGRRIAGYRHAMWSGVTTLHLAEIIESVLYRHPELHGVYHISSGRTSKLALLEQLRAGYDLDVEITPDDTFSSDRTLIGTRFEQATGYRCPPLTTLIRDLVTDRTPYPALS
jgi:dTDP-4-dehydrorhamnose reductase